MARSGQLGLSVEVCQGRLRVATSILVVPAGRKGLKSWEPGAVWRKVCETVAQPAPAAWGGTREGSLSPALVPQPRLPDPTGEHSAGGQPSPETESWPFPLSASQERWA